MSDDTVKNWRTKAIEAIEHADGPVDRLLLWVVASRWSAAILFTDTVALLLTGYLLGRP